MKLSRRQQIALKLIDSAVIDIEWTGLSAAMNMVGERIPNGRVTGESLVAKGLAVNTRQLGWAYRITDKGREVAKTISVTLQIEQVTSEP